MSEIAVTTFQEDFDEIHGRLVGMGATERALDGMIQPEGRPAFRAIYRATVEPPTLTQIVPSGHGNMTATYTRVSVAEDDTPVVQTGRYTYEVPEAAEDIYTAVTDPEKTRIGNPTGDAAEAYFDSVYENAITFEPNA
jgi:hypothetical protein